MDAFRIETELHIASLGISQRLENDLSRIAIEDRMLVAVTKDNLSIGVECDNRDITVRKVPFFERGKTASTRKHPGGLIRTLSR